jgi:hypothetical protein
MWPDAWDCKTVKDPADLGLTDVCEVFTDAHLTAAVSANVRTQRVFGWALCLVSTFAIVGICFIGEPSG